MRNLIVGLMVLVAGTAFAGPTAFQVTFSNGSSVTATPAQDGSYTWTKAGALMVVKIEPASFKSVSRILVTWSGGVSEMSGNAPGDGSAPVMMTIFDTRSKVFDNVTVTPVP